MTKIAFIAVNYIIDYDGISVYLENILRILLNHELILSQKIKLDIYANNNSIKLLKERVLTTKSKNIDFIKINNKKILKFLHLQLKLLNTKYDLVFVPTPMPLFFSFGKTIKVIHDLTIKQTPELFSKNFHLYIDFLIKYMIKRDFAIGYISKQTKDDIKKFYNITNKRMIYLPNGIPFKVQSYKRPSLKKSIEKFHSKKLRFVVVGRINYAKGFDRILKFLTFFDIYLNKNNIFESVSIDIVGKQTDETTKLFKDKRFKNIILNFKGYVNDKELNKLYINSHFCLFLSRNEGYGLPLVEALWFRTIPIVSNIPIFEEILGNYPKFDDSDGFENSIVEFIKKTYFDELYQKEIFKKLENIVKKEKNGYKLATKNLLEVINV